MKDKHGRADSQVRKSNTKKLLGLVKAHSNIKIVGTEVRGESRTVTSSAIPTFALSFLSAKTEENHSKSKKFLFMEHENRKKQ